MTILDRALAHRAGLGLASLAVPEWGESGLPLTVQWSPMTPAEHAKLFKDAGLGIDARTYTGIVLLKALDADGKRLFDDSAETRQKLLEGSDLAVIIRIANAITAPFVAKPAI